MTTNIIQEGLLAKALQNLRDQPSLMVGDLSEMIEGNDTVKISSNIDLKAKNGGINRGRFLVMLPVGQYAKITDPHFILLRKIKPSDTPTGKIDRELIWSLMLHKQELNNEGQKGDLNHDRFECSIVGQYKQKKNSAAIGFDAIPSEIAPAINYAIYAPDANLLNIIVNSQTIQDGASHFHIGTLRQSQAGSVIQEYKEPMIPVYVRHIDFENKRTLVCGKTGYGKSNFAKICISNMHSKVSQLIFDEGGENCNPNPKLEQGMRCTAEMIPNSVVYGLSYKKDHPDRKLLCPDFYMYPQHAVTKLRISLRRDGETATYTLAPFETDMPSIEEAQAVEDYGNRNRLARKIKIFWGILYKAEFAADENALPTLPCGSGNTGCPQRGKFALGLGKNILQAIYPGDPSTWPIIDSLSDMLFELERIYLLYERSDAETRQDLFTTGGRGERDTFDGDDMTLLRFLFPAAGRAGTEKLKVYRKFHQKGAGSGVAAPINDLDEGRTVFLDLSGEDPQLKEEASEELTRAVFNHRVNLFTSNDTTPRNLLVYYEEAQTLLPKRSPYKTNEDETIYVKMAKQGRKYGIGMVVITQDLSVMDEGILSQVENWIALYMSSKKETKTLSYFNSDFEEYAYDINKAKTEGYARVMMDKSIFVVSTQVDLLGSSVGVI